MKNLSSQKTNFQIIIYALIITVVCVGVYYWIETENNFLLSTNSSVDLNLSSIEYSNAEYGYSLLYPTDWSIEEIDPINIHFYFEEVTGGRRYDLTIMIEEGDAVGLTSQQWVEQMLAENRRLVATNELPGGIRYNREERITLGGQECYALREVFAFDRSDDQIYCSIGGNIYQFIFPSESNTDSVFNSAENYQSVQEILQSVAFTDHAIENSPRTSQVDDRSLYTLIKEPEDKYLGTGYCGEGDFTDYVSQALTEDMYKLELPGDYELVWTANSMNWTNEGFSSFNSDDNAICAVGGRYPLKAFTDKLLWYPGGCDGALPEEGTEAYEEFQKCEESRALVEDFFK